MSNWNKFCGWLLRKKGWTTVGGPVPEKKAVILGVPHTSVKDFIISYLFYTQFDAQKARVMIKKEFFFWPLGPLIRRMGAVPVDRSNAASLVKSLIDQMEKEDTFILAGYHLIAKAVGCPVYLGYFDWGRKRVSAGEKVELTDDARADTDRIQAIYEEMHLEGRHPEGYITH